MNSNSRKVLTGALIAGLMSGTAAFAEDPAHSDAAAPAAKVEKEKCKGHKEKCKGHKGHGDKEKCKGAKGKHKNKCNGPDGCGGEKHEGKDAPKE